LLILWVRTPGLRGRRIPIKALDDMAYLFEPEKERRTLIIGSHGMRFNEADMLTDVAGAGELRDMLRQKRKPRSFAKEIGGGIIRGVFTELGGGFLKLAQIMSMRPEAPPFMREELAALQDKQPILTPKEVKRVIEKELQCPIEEIFEWVHYSAVASATLAVVHHAKLISGEEVALKIQRPSAQGQVFLDIKIILGLIALLQKIIPGLWNSDLGVFTTSFGERTLKELDFELEGRIQERFRIDVQNDPGLAGNIKIAKVYGELTTGKLLTMEYIKGFVRFDELFDKLTLDELVSLWQWRDPKLPDVPAQIFMIQLTAICNLWVFEKGYFHGDLHGGNMYFIPPKYSETGDWQTFFCDFGMFEDFGWGSEKHRMIAHFFAGAFNMEPEIISDVVCRMHLSIGGELSRREIRAIQKTEDLISEVAVKHLAEGGENEVFEQSLHGRLSRGGQSVGMGAINSLLDTILHENIHIWPEVWLVMKSMMYYESLSTDTLTGSYINYSDFVSKGCLRTRKDTILEYVRRSNIFTLHERVSLMAGEFVPGRQQSNRDAVEDIMGEILRRCEE